MTWVRGVSEDQDGMAVILSCSLTLGLGLGTDNDWLRLKGYWKGGGGSLRMCVAALVELCNSGFKTHVWSVSMSTGRINGPR